MITLNKQFFTYMFLTLAFVGIATYWGYYYPMHKNNSNTMIGDKNRNIVDMTVENQKIIIDRLSKHSDLQSQLMYDIEKSVYSNTQSDKDIHNTIQKYKDMYASNTLAINNKVNSSDKYKRDMAIYGWLYLYNKIWVASTTMSDEKAIATQVMGSMKKMLKIANEVTSPEVANDKVFLASRLQLESTLLISFMNKLNKDEIKSYQKMISSDLEAMNRTGMSIFSSRNSKFNLTPIRVKMLADIALYQSGALGGNANDIVSGVYKEYQNVKTGDASAYAINGVAINLYYLYYLGILINDNAIATSTQIKMAEADLVKSINHSEYTKSNSKLVANHLQTPQGKWEILNMAIIDKVK